MIRMIRLGPPAAVLLILCCPIGGQSLAAWTADGVTVSSTTASIPAVEACSDGGEGTFVVWQEESSTGQGVLRAKHLFSDGELDPAWPVEGAHVCDIVTARPYLGALPDRLGGFYAWWKEGGLFFASRILGDGQVAPGWPARGRQLGVVNGIAPTPSVIEDGANGFYAAWGAQEAGPLGRIVVLGMHLGPTNTGAGGWPNATRMISPDDPVTTYAFYPQIALAPDGGIFLAHGTRSNDSTEVPHGFRVRRLTSAGLNASPWPADAVNLGRFHADDITHFSTALLSISADGRGGAFVLTGNPVGNEGGQIPLETRLHRIQGDGVPEGDWPAGGRVLTSGPTWLENLGVDGSYRVLTDGADRAFAGFGSFPVDAPAAYFTARVGAAGPEESVAHVNMLGHELVQGPDMSLFFGDFKARGRSGPFDTDAHLRVSLRPDTPQWSDFHEVHTEISTTWFKDIGLAPAGDGVVLFWSQVHQRIGLFARRFTALGQVTGVPDVGASFALRGVRFVPGAGVRAWIDVPEGARARIDLFDAGGRRVAARSFATRGAEMVIPGTRDLESGLYFARVSGPGGIAAAKVVVAR